MNKQLILIISAVVLAGTLCNCKTRENEMKEKAPVVVRSDILSIGFVSTQYDIIRLAERYGFTYQIIDVGSTKEQGLTVQKDTYYWIDQCKRFDDEIVHDITSQLDSKPGMVVMSMRPPWQAYPETAREKILSYLEQGGKLLIFQPDKAFLASLKTNASEFNTSFKPMDVKDLFVPKIYSYGKGQVAVLPSQGDYRKVLLTPTTTSSDKFEYQFARIAGFMNSFLRDSPQTGSIEIDKNKISAQSSSPAATKCKVEIFDQYGKLDSIENTSNQLQVKRVLPNGRKVFLTSFHDAQNRLVDVSGTWTEVKNVARIESLSFVDTTVFKANQQFELKIVADAIPDSKLNVVFEDNHQRIFWKRELESGSQKIKDIMPDSSLTVLNRAIVNLEMDGNIIDRQVIEFTIPENMPKKDFYFFAWHGGVDLAVRQFEYTEHLKKYGLDGFANMNIYDFGARSAALSNMLTIPYAAAFHNITLDSLFDDNWVKKQNDSAMKAVESNKPYGGFAFTLGDENYISPFKDKGRFHDDPKIWRLFQEWLRKQYPDLNALNRQWDKQYINWEEIRFSMEEELFNLENPSAWVDYRQFITNRFISVQKNISNKIKEVLPHAYVGWDGAEQFSSYDGYDWYPYISEFDLNNVYARYLIPNHGLKPKIFNGHCLRSFAGKDSLTGIWGNTLEYPHGFRYTIFSALFYGYKSAWWWTSTFPESEIGALQYDLKPSKMFNQLQLAVNEVKQGPATIITHTKPQQAPIAIYYSAHNWHASNLSSGAAGHINSLGNQEFQWFSELPGRYIDPSPELKKMWSGITNLGHYAVASMSFITLLRDMQIAFDMIDGRQIAGGGLGKYQILILPFVESLSDTEAAAIRDFAKNGGVVIADYRCGIRDEHCKFRKSGVIDDIFGIRQEFPFATTRKKQNVRIDDYIGWGFKLPIVYNQPLADNNRKFGSTEDGSPVFLINPYENGYGVYFNFDLYAYWELRSLEHDYAMREFLERTLTGLTNHRLTRPVTGADGKVLNKTSLFRLQDGTVDYAAVIRDYQLNNFVPADGFLRFISPGHLYDVLNHRYLGYADQVRLTVVPAEPQLIARYPYQIKELKTEATRNNDKIELSMEVVNFENCPAAGHTVSIKVTDPDGRKIDYLNKTLYLTAGKGTYSIPLALNSPVGEWQLEIRESASGLTAYSRVNIR